MLSDGGSRALVTRVVLDLDWDLDWDWDKEETVGTVKVRTVCVRIFPSCIYCTVDRGTG